MDRYGLSGGWNLLNLISVNEKRMTTVELDIKHSSNKKKMDSL